jgi:hypothetical protein
VCTTLSVALDRRRQDFDVVERVLGSVHDHEAEPHPDVVEVDVKPGIIGTTSVVETTELGRDDDEDTRRGRSGPSQRDRFERRNP